MFIFKKLVICFVLAFYIFINRKNFKIYNHNDEKIFNDIKKYNNLQKQLFEDYNELFVNKDLFCNNNIKLCISYLKPLNKYYKSLLLKKPLSLDLFEDYFNIIEKIIIKLSKILIIKDNNKNVSYNNYSINDIMNDKEIFSYYDRIDSNCKNFMAHINQLLSLYDKHSTMKLIDNITENPYSEPACDFDNYSEYDLSDNELFDNDDIYKLLPNEDHIVLNHNDVVEYIDEDDAKNYVLFNTEKINIGEDKVVYGIHYSIPDNELNKHIARLSISSYKNCIKQYNYKTAVIKLHSLRSINVIKNNINAIKHNFQIYKTKIKIYQIKSLIFRIFNRNIIFYIICCMVLFL